MLLPEAMLMSKAGLLLETILMFMAHVDLEVRLMTSYAATKSHLDVHHLY